MKLDFDKIKENASRMDAGQRPGYKAQSVAPASQSPLNFERVIANAKLRDEQSGVHAAPKPAPTVAPRPKPIAPKLPTYRSTLDGMADGAMPLSTFAQKKLEDARLSPVRTKGLTAERDRLDASLTQSQNRINAGESADVDGMKRDQYRINGLNRQLDAQKAELYEAGLAGQRAAMEQKAGPVSGAKLSPDRRTEDLLQTYPGYGPAPRDKNGVTDAARYLSDPEFRKAAQARMKQDNTLDDAFEPLDYMTETERNTLVFYVQAGDLQSAEKYKALLDRTLNARRQQKQSATMERAAKENPILGTVNNLLSSFGSGFALAGTAGQAVKNLVTGKDEPTDYNSKWFKNAHVMNDTAQGVHRAAYDAAGGGTWGEIAAGAADMGLSLGQTVTKMPLGPAALPMMALTAGGQSSLGALERGASTGQALAFGTTTGLVEALTEKLPLDALFAIAKTGKKGVKAVLGSVLKQMGSEASEEMVSELAGTLADKAIIGTRSEYENYVADLVSQGMDEEQARQAATKQFYLHNVAKAGLGGAVTGGVMAGGANIIGSIGNKNAQAPLKPNRLLTGKEQFEQSQVQNEQKNTAEGADFKAYVEDSISKSRFVETPVISSEVKPPLDIGAVSKGLADKILGEYNVDISAKRHQVNDNDLRHIYNRHGPHTNEKYPVTIGDLIEIPNIIDHADDVYFVSRRDGKSGLVYQKRRNGTTYYLEQIVDNSDVLQNKQMIKVPTGTYPDIPGLRDAIEKKRSISPAPDGSAYAAPQMYAQGVRDNASLDPTLSQGQGGVNTEDMQNGGKDAAVPQSHRLLTGKEQFEQSQVQTGQKKSAEVSALPKMSMADFTDAESSVWNNVEYDDTKTRAGLQGRAHQEMVDAGQVVHIPEDTIAQTGESFPDLRTVKKKERVPMLKQKMDVLKRTLRDFLGQLKGGSYEFEVNGNILETRLYDTGINEVMEKVTQDKASMLYHSEEIFKNARYLYSTPDYEGNPNIYRWNYFYTPVKIGTETVGVRIAVRDMVPSAGGGMDSQIYNWGIKKGTTLDGGGPGGNPNATGVSSVVPSGAPLDGGQRGSMPDQSGVSSGVPSDITLPQGKSGVNTEGMQNGGEDAGLNAKATEYLSRALKRAVEKVAGILSVPKNGSRETLLPILQALSDGYLKNGTVDKSTLDGLFETAYKNGMMIDDEYYRQYADLRNRLRTVPVSISDTDKSGIADYGAFRKSNMGKLNITKNGTPVDVAYMELSQSAPELFPPSISNPTDMLLKMAEVADSFRKIEADLDAYYGDDAENFKKYARHEFDGVVEELLPELEKVKRYSEAVKREREQADKLLKVVESDLSENLISEIGRRWAEKKKLHRVEAAAVRKNLLSPEDNRTVGRLLRGEITLDELPSGSNASGVREVYEAKKAVQDAMRPIVLFNKHRKAALRVQADKILEGSETWRDKAAGLLYSRETMERNIRYVVEDPARAQEIIDKYFTPVHKNEAKRNKLKNELRDKARALNLSRKVNKGNQASEAAAVQFLGEAEDNIAYLKEHGGKDMERNGKTLEQWLSAKQEFIDQNPALDLDKVNGAVDAFREIYDSLFEQMNASRIRNGYEPVDYRRGYFPHFSEKGGDGLLNTFAAALGVKMEVQNLPTTINGITHIFRPGIRWSGNALQRTGNGTVYDALEGFDMYVEGISDVIYHTDDIQRLRAFSDQMRYRASDEAIRARVDKVRENPELDELEKRAAIEEIYKDAPTALSNFVVELEEYTNLLANKKSRRDREVEGDFGRGIYNAAKALESRVAANMVAINPASWLTNLIPLTQGGAEVKGISLAASMKDTLKAYLKDDGFVSRSSFLTNRRGSEPLVRDAMERLSAKAGKGMNIIDEFTADSLVRARYRDNIARGMTETAAMDEADGWAASVMADRSKGALPTIFEAKNPVTKLLTQFQVEVNNQLSHLYSDIPRQQKEKGAAALALVLLKFMVGAFLYNELYEKLIGRRPALDPLGMLNETVGDATGYKLPNAVDAGSELLHGRLPNFQTEKKSAAGAVAGAGGRIAEELPFVGGLLGGGRLPINSALPSVATLAKAGTNLIAGEGNADKQKAVIGRELAKPLYYVVPPFGGGQVKKAYEGIKAVLDGGAYSVDAKGRDVMQYPVLNDSHALPTAATMARVAAFGKSSLPTAQTWVKSGFKGSSAAETAVYQGLIGMGTQRKSAYELVEALSGIESGEDGKPTMQAEYLHKKELRPEEKAVAYYGMIASDNERLLMDDMEKAGVPAGSAYEMLTSIKTAPAGGKRQELAALDGTDAKSAEKYGAYYGLIASDEERETMDALKKSGIQDGTAYELLSAVGSVPDGEGEKDRKRAALLGVKGLTPSQKSGLGVSLVGDERILDYSSAEALTISTMPESTREKANAAKKARISDKVFIAAYEAQKGIAGDKDRNGETVELSAARKKKAAIDRAARGLTYAQKTTLYEMFGVSRKVWAELPGG